MADITFQIGEYVYADVYNTGTRTQPIYRIEISGHGSMFEQAGNFKNITSGSSIAWSSVVIYCAQDTLTIPNGITSIARNCFSGLGQGTTALRRELDGVNHIEIGEDVEVIGEQAFKGLMAADVNNNKQPLHKPQSVVVLGKEPKLRKLGINAFQYNSQMRVCELRGYVEEVGTGCFEECRLVEDVQLADNWTLEKLSGINRTFKNCHNLKHISPNNTVGNTDFVLDGFEMFLNCNCLDTFTFNNTEWIDPKEEMDEMAFYVDMNAGSVLDEEGYFITHVYCDNEDILRYIQKSIDNFKYNAHRILILELIDNDCVYLAHMGRWIKIPMHEDGMLPLAHCGELKYIRATEGSEVQSRTPLHFTHKGKWYQIEY